MQPALFFEPGPLPRLPGPAVGHKGPKIGQKPEAGCIILIRPNVCPEELHPRNGASVGHRRTPSFDRSLKVSLRAPKLPYPRGLAGPEIVDRWGLNGHLLPQNPLEKVGGFAPHLFEWVFADGAV